MAEKKEIIWQNCEFRIGAVKIEDIPLTSSSEIAFAGRSNVGKSSLINAITGRNTLSRVSRTPGCTRQVNFFLLSGKIYLVDMPGYGFAQRGKKEIAGWGKLINDYLGGRQNLRRVFLLIDSRHGLKPSDLKIMSLLNEKAVVYQIVLTKIDKATEETLEKVMKKIQAVSDKNPALHPVVIKTSANEKIGVEELREEINSLVS